MRKSAAVSLLVVALLLVSAAPSHAWRGHGHRHHRHHGVHTRFFIGVGPSFWWGPGYPYWYYPPPAYYYYPPPYYVYSPPPEPPVYAQQPQAPTAQSYWHYCPSAKAYYPNVQTCPEAWIKVPPRPE